MKRLTTSAVVAVILLIRESYADMIYDVTFEDPPHTLDGAVVAGAGTDRPSATIGSVITRSGLADFSTQVASLEPAGRMGFLYGPAVSSGLVSLRWDLAMLNFGPGGLTDTAQLSIMAGNGGSGAIVMFWQRDLDLTIGGANVATFAASQQDHYEFLFDLDNDRFDFAFNGVPALTNQNLNADFNIQNVLFGAENLQSPSYAVDNFQWEAVPEPSTLYLAFLGAIIGGRAIRKRIRKPNHPMELTP